MAGDWIKMRSDLYRDPKVCVMADLLMDSESELSAFVNQQMQRDMTVTRNVMRNVTVGALLSVWGVMRTQGKREDCNLVVKGCSVSVIDDIADLPGFGRVMESVGWVEENAGTLVFPRFFEEHNADPTEKFKAANAERQRRFREKKEAVNSNVTVTLHNATEKRREENSKDIDTPCTEAEAWQFAKGLHQLPPWTEQAVTKWYSTRASSHWTKGGVNQFPITSKTWKEDLRSSHSWATQQQANAHNPKYSTRPASRNSTSLPAGLPSLNDTAENSRVS